MLKNVCKLLVCFIWVILFSFSIFSTTSVPKKVLDASMSVYRIVAEYQNEYSMGSGFIVSKNGSSTYLVTNNHVISEKPLSIYVIDEIGNELEASIFAVDYKKDIAILKVTTHLTGKVLVLNENGINKGDVVYAVGFPGAADYVGIETTHQSTDATITDGIASSIKKGQTLEGANVDMIQISAAINSGNSGGPLFNKNGEVVGVNTYSAEDSQGIYWAIAIKEAINLMQSKNLDILPPTSTSINSKDFISFSLFFIAATFIILVPIMLIRKIKSNKLLCLECGTNNPKKSRFCKKCGNTLHDIKSSSLQTYATHMRFCKKCGHELLKGTMFCKHCGEQIYYYTGDKK